MIAKQLFKKVLFILILFLVSIAARHILLGGVYLSKLNTAPPLAASIAPSIVTHGSTSLPQAGKDFKILSSQYFDNKQWAIVSVSSGPDTDTAFLVMERLGGVYTVVLGPGTFFSSDVTQSMPPDVAAYLTGQGLIH
jgi:hypothetical protein